jgi:hypothetical protein
MLKLGEKNRKRLEQDVWRTLQNYTSSGACTYEGRVTIRNNHDANPLLFCLPKVLAKLITECANDEFTMDYTIWNWQDSFRGDRGINIAFANRSFHVKELARISMQKLSTMDAKLNLETSLYRTSTGMEILKKLNKIFDKYDLCEFMYACCVHDATPIRYRHVVSTPQTDVFHLTVFLYNHVVEMMSKKQADI